MKLLTLLLFSVLNYSVAQEGPEGGRPGAGKTLEEAKKHTLEMIDMRIKALQESKSCVQAATSKEAMHACKKDAKDDLKEFKGRRDEFKKEWKEKREGFREKREEWKKKRREGMKEGGPRPDAPPPEDAE